MAGLDDIRENVERPRGTCKYCPDAATAYVEVRVRERANKNKQVVSRSVSACDRHTVELFNDLETQIHKRRNGKRA